MSYARPDRSHQFMGTILEIAAKRLPSGGNAKFTDEGNSKKPVVAQGAAR